MPRHLNGGVDDVFHEALAEAEQGDVERRAALKKTNVAFCERALAALLEAEPMSPVDSSGRANTHYLNNSAANPATTPPEQPSLRSEVANILDVDRQSNMTELQSRRREFARRYHPDLVPEKSRKHAEELMKIANAIIDERLSALPGK